jgi:hypothetical protein
MTVVVALLLQELMVASWSVQLTWEAGTVAVTLATASFYTPVALGTWVLLGKAGTVAVTLATAGFYTPVALGTWVLLGKAAGGDLQPNRPRGLCKILCAR